MKNAIIIVYDYILIVNVLECLIVKEISFLKNLKLKLVGLTVYTIRSEYVD